MRVERQRIEQPRIEPPPQRVDPLQPADRADIELVLERGEIRALDEQPELKGLKSAVVKKKGTK